MGGFSGATGLAAYREEDDEELFETSSSISDDEDDQLSDGEGAYDLSSVMAQLPVKKGLSRYYDGKSQSFACMSEVRCLEDLRKKETPYKKIKSSRSYVALDEEQQDCHTLDPNSRAPGSCCANLVARNNGKNMLYRPPPVPVNKRL